MAKKQSGLEKAIASIDAKIQALQAARDVLMQTAASLPKRKAKAKPADEARQA